MTLEEQIARLEEQNYFQEKLLTQLVNALGELLFRYQYLQNILFQIALSHCLSPPVCSLS